MFDFLSIGRTKPEKPVAAGGASTDHHPTSTQREMVRLALHSVLKRNGIPGNWIGCEITLNHRADHADSVMLQLVVLKWHDSLMHYAPALQNELLEGLRRFDLNADQARYTISWKFGPNCGCPHTQLPEPGFWGGVSAPAPLTDIAAPAVPERIPFDLPDTLADDDEDDHGFAPTQIHNGR